MQSHEISALHDKYFRFGDHLKTDRALQAPICTE